MMPFFKNTEEIDKQIKEARLELLEAKHEKTIAEIENQKLVNEEAIRQRNLKWFEKGQFYQILVGFGLAAAIITFLINEVYLPISTAQNKLANVELREIRLQNSMALAKLELLKEELDDRQDQIDEQEKIIDQEKEKYLNLSDKKDDLENKIEQYSNRLSSIQSSIINVRDITMVPIDSNFVFDDQICERLGGNEAFEPTNTRINDFTYSFNNSNPSFYFNCGISSDFFDFSEWDGKVYIFIAPRHFSSLESFSDRFQSHRSEFFDMWRFYDERFHEHNRGNISEVISIIQSKYAVNKQASIALGFYPGTRNADEQGSCYIHFFYLLNVHKSI